MTWPMAQFDEAIIDITRGNQKVLQRNYLSEGAIPIIDQGQSLVALPVPECVAGVRG